MVETADILLSRLKGRMCCGKKSSAGQRMSLLNENRKFEHPTDRSYSYPLVSPSKTDFVLSLLLLLL